MSKIESGHFTTNDGVVLHFLESGSGPTLVLLPGWSQTASLFHHQLEELSESFHCLALDYRGHGESSRPSYGYRLSRFAMDLLQLLETKDLEDVILLGHSAGCAVIWNFIDLFGENILRGLILCDQMIARVKRLEWSKLDCQYFGALVTGDEVLKEAGMIGGSKGEQNSREFLTNMFTTAFPEAELAQIIEESLKFPRPYAAELLLSVSYADYRDLLPRISLPTLCIGGEGSHLGPEVMPWIASQIPRGQVTMINADKGGSHFAFVENPSAFNSVVLNFCNSIEN